MAAQFDKASRLKGLKKSWFFIANAFSYIIPNFIYIPYMKLRFFLLPAKYKREAESRVDYYYRLSDKAHLSGQDCTSVGDFTFPFRSKKRFSTYFFDLYSTLRLFPKHLRLCYYFGDVNYETPQPAFTKARPIVSDGQYSNSVLMKLNSIRHYIFYNDHLKWQQKKDMLVFRNVVRDKPHRELFLTRTFSSPMCDSGEVGRDPVYEDFVKPYMPVAELLKYKFIATIEGNDVATNLKWVMASNSIAVMPRPKIESWYMEASLIPGYHYIEIADDYSDIEEKLQYYLDHPDEALAIIDHAHEYAKKFRHRTTERYIQYKVAQRYFLALQ